MKNHIAVLLLSSLATLAVADDKDQIEPDRPDFVESSKVVGKGRFQIETGIAGEHDKTDGLSERTLTTPALLRLGVSDTLELRAESDGRTWYRAGGAGQPAVRAQGYGDLSLGVKWHVLDAQGARPSVGLLFDVALDSGSGPFRGEGKRPSARISGDWDLPNDFSLGMMTGVVRERTPMGGRYTSSLLAASLAKGWTDHFQTYVELAAPHIANSAHGGSTLSFDFGGAYLLSDSLQVDTGFARGLNHHTADISWTVGVSARF